jgi:hypothetical protein
MYNHFSYSEKLARRIKAVGHTDDDCHFFRATENQSYQEMAANLSSVSGFVMIAIDGKNSGFLWVDSDSLIERPTYSLVILRQTSINDVDQMFESMELCKVIALQCIAKMLQDARQYVDGCHLIDPASFSIDGVGPVADNFFGVIIQFSLLQGIDYMIDPDMWIKTDLWDTLRS